VGGHYWKVQQNVENGSVPSQILCQTYSYPWFVERTKAANDYYVPSKKEKKKKVNVPMVLERSSGVSQNSNFVTSIMEFETDDDEIDDGINVTILSLLVNCFDGIKTISSPPANNNIF
jgi:hypothetical protein